MLEIKNRIKIPKKELTAQEVQDIKKLLTIQNPMFLRLESMGKPTWTTPKRFFYFEDSGEYLYVVINLF